MPVVRIRIAGVDAFGWSRVTLPQASQLIGRPVVDLFQPTAGDMNPPGDTHPPGDTKPPGNHISPMRGTQFPLAGLTLRPVAAPIEFPLLDAVGRLLQKPVYALVGSKIAGGKSAVLRVPVYDTSIYFDDLDIPDDAGATDMFRSEVEEGISRGHRNFKVKVGRGAMWMDLEAGMRRDAAVVHAVRSAAGPEAVVMADANNGFNLALTRRFLEDTADARLFWMEEPFHEDSAYLTSLHDWIKTQGLETRIADGEGNASPQIVEWAANSLVNILQYDLRDYGFLKWAALGRMLDSLGILSAPHNYGGFYGNYAQCHLATAISGFCFAEWDEAKVEGINTDNYRISEGMVHVPSNPGFGLEMDSDRFDADRNAGGWTAGR